MLESLKNIIPDRLKNFVGKPHGSNDKDQHSQTDQEKILAFGRNLTAGLLTLAGIELCCGCASLVNYMNN